MVIRRLIDKGRDVQSVSRLLIEIRLHRDVLTRQRYLDLHFDTEAERAGQWFDSRFGRGSDRVCDEVLDEDLALLDEVGGPVARWATSTVAHMLDRPAHTTFGEIHAALEAIGGVLRRYYGLMKATDPDLVPTLAGDWREPFKRPLYGPGSG
jgi:hypothetical protein